MEAIIIPSAINGKVTAPASKSAMQRACAASLIRRGTTLLSNPGHSADDLAALDIIRQLGADTKAQDGNILISSQGIRPVSGQIHCGESGLSVRLFTSLVATVSATMTINGKGSLLKRPLGFFDEVFPKLGVNVQSSEGYLPLTVKGPMKPGEIEIDGSLSSQFLTGLLFAYAACGASDVSIKVKHLNSRPYIDLTLEVMRSFGLPVPIQTNYREFYFPKVSPSVFHNEQLRFTVEGDWSGASFLLVAGAVAGSVSVTGLDVFSSQADKSVLQALMQCGAVMSIREGQVDVSRNKLKAFHFDATNAPDLFPPLVALASYCEGTSVIEGVRRLEHKESNRGLTLQSEFGKMGVDITLQDDLMLIKSKGPVVGAPVDAHGDHRIAMACGVAALQAEGTTRVQGAEAVDKSYPGFWDHMELLGAEVSLINTIK